MSSVTVSNEELRTVRDAMRELNRMVESLTCGDLHKFVLTQRNQMKVVLLPLDRFVQMERCTTNCTRHKDFDAAAA
jgi:hypothetical protein